MGEVRDRFPCWPLTRLEQWMPVAFAAIYVSGFPFVVFSDFR